MPMGPTPTQPLASGNTTTQDKKPCHHQQMLARLEPDLDSMRNLITCKICQRFLSEPYGLACGHTYCYVCLDAWLVAQRKRTCPDCRATIKQQPVPSFLIREMTRVFAYRAELLPDGETVEEHDEYIKEAVAKVSEDKESGGLFSGLFRNAERLQWGPLHDPGDDVDRCPNCHWELEEGRCGSCGLNIGDEDGFGLDTGESESSDEDDELDNEMVPHDYDDGMEDPGSFDEDDFMDEDGGHHYPHDDDEHDGLDLDAFGVLPRPAAALRRQRRYGRDPINLDSEPESEDSVDPDNDPQMEGFLDNDVIEELDSDDSQEQSDSEPEAEETPRNNRPRQLIRPMVIHDSDDDIPQQPRRPVVIESSDDEEEGPVARNNQRAGKVSRGTRRPQIHEISSSEDTSDDDDDAEEGDRHNANGARARAAAPERRHRSIPVDSESCSNSDVNSESADADGVDADGFSPMQSEGDNESQADDFEGNYGAYGVYEQHFGHDSDGENFPPFYQQGESDIDDDYGHDRAQHDMDILNAMNYDNDDDDDGGRSTTAGFAPFLSPSFSPSKLLTSFCRYSD